jgi:hypothetical protein
MMKPVFSAAKGLRPSVVVIENDSYNLTQRVKVELFTQIQSEVHVIYVSSYPWQDEFIWRRR